MPAALPLIADMLAGATDVRPLQDAPGKSGARLERLTVGGVGCVVKYLDRASDWTLRASGVLAGPVVAMWTRGLLDRLPACINQPIIGVAVDDPGTPDQRTAVLMRDVGPDLIPAVDDVLPLATHLRLLDHMAVFHATFWQAGRRVRRGAGDAPVSGAFTVDLARRGRHLLDAPGAPADRPWLAVTR